MNIYSTTGEPANLTRIYYSKRFLDKLRNANVWYELCDKNIESTVPVMEGNTIQWTRLKNLGEGQNINEGNNPSGKILSTEVVTATLVQKGEVVKISDILNAATMLRQTNAVVDVMGYSAGVTLDGMIKRAATFGIGAREGEIHPSTFGNDVPSDYHVSVYLGDTGSLANYAFPYITFSNETLLSNSSFFGTYSQADSGLVNSAFKMSIAKVQGAVTYLKKKNCEPFEDGFYRAIMNEDDILRLKRDSEFMNWNMYSRSDMAFIKGEVGAIDKVRIIGSNNATMLVPIFSATVLTTSAFITTIVGKGGLVCAGHEAPSEVGMNAASAYSKPIVEIKKSGSGDTSNPLSLYFTVGYKVYLAAKVLDRARGVNLLQFYSSSANRQ